MLQSWSSGLLREARCCSAAEAVQDRCLHSSVGRPPLEAGAHRAGLYQGLYLFIIYLHSIIYLQILLSTVYKPCPGQRAGSPGGAHLHYRDGRGLDTGQVLHHAVHRHLQSDYNCIHGFQKSRQRN